MGKDRPFRDLEADLIRSLSQLEVGEVKITPETVLTLSKISHQQQEVAQQILQNEDFRSFVENMESAQIEAAKSFQEIDFSGIDAGRIEKLATSDFVVESAIEAEEDLPSEEVDPSNELTDETIEQIIETSSAIALFAASKGGLEQIGEDEIMVLSILICFMILHLGGWAILPALAGTSVLAPLASSSISALKNRV
ncbi:hypothetical protein ACFQL9_13425 [Halobaculum lipolyticum]|uniref:Uncharacterized protein n=1 Tax=Halobaculum lipolyticum TaxID=3032001 RepID=A0ABD5WBH2_9EURY